MWKLVSEISFGSLHSLIAFVGTLGDLKVLPPWLPVAIDREPGPSEKNLLHLPYNYTQRSWVQGNSLL